MARIAMLVAVTVGALGAAAISSAGNDPLAQVARCGNGGWKQLEPTAGGDFASQTSCMTYAAAGGAVRAAVIRIPHGRLDCLDPEKHAITPV